MVKGFRFASLRVERMGGNQGLLCSLLVAKIFLL